MPDPGDRHHVVGSAARLRWEVRAWGTTHEVELGKWSAVKGAPRKFRADGVEHRIGFFLRGQRTVAFNLGGHEATMTMRYVTPRYWTQFKRTLGGTLKSLPTAIGALFGAGPEAVGSGAAAMGSSRMLAWVVYTLRLNGTDQGSLVARVEGGQLLRWTFVKAGESLPVAET